MGRLYLAGWRRNRTVIGAAVAKKAPTERADEAQERVPERSVVSRARSCGRERIPQAGEPQQRQQRKKLEPSAERLLGLLHRWRDEAVKAGRTITRIALAFEAGRDGFWLARWLLAHGVEAHVIHPSSVAVSREHRRAKTDRLDTELLKRGFLGWLCGERGHCTMARLPTIAEEDAKRPNRERECLVERFQILNMLYEDVQ
jgi:hypothetical protein